MPSSQLPSEDAPVGSGIKYDKDGLPLVPQPTESPFDPLNYPMWLKLSILAQVGLITFIGVLNITISNPAVVPLSKEFGIEPVQATYPTTIAIGVGALGPLVFTPFAEVYGRRPAYLICVLLGFVSAVWAANTTSYGTLIIARALNGFGPSAAQAPGAGTVVDLFYIHQRGKAMGFFTLMLTNGAHISPIIGGYVTKARGWRWCFWVGAILNGIMFIVCIFFLPETLFERNIKEEATADQSSCEVEYDKGSETNSTTTIVPYSPAKMKLKTYLRKLGLWFRLPSRRLSRRAFFITPLSMFRYPTVAFPAMYYGITYGYASIEAGLTVPTLFTRIYEFDTVRNGLAVGVSLLVGATLGEICAGPVTDVMMQRARKRALISGMVPPPEIRLIGIYPGAIAVPVGLLIYGFTVHYAVIFIAPCIGMAVACFGIQIVSSVTYTYSCGDCHQSRSNDASICFHVCRQLFGLPLGFYSIPLGNKIGFQWSFTIYAAICVTAFLPLVVLIFKGERWRKEMSR